MSTFDWRPIIGFVPQNAAGSAIIEMEFHPSTSIFASVLKCLGSPPTKQNIGDNVYFNLDSEDKITKFILIEKILERKSVAE